MENFNNKNKYIKAKERVNRLKKFYSNLLSYLVFIAFLAGLNYYVNGLRSPWFLWAAFGWGIGITIHAFKVFNWLPYMNKNWEDRKIKEYMNEEDGNNTKQWS